MHTHIKHRFLTCGIYTQGAQGTVRRSQEILAAPCMQKCKKYCIKFVSSRFCKRNGMNVCLHLGRKAVLSVKNPQHKMEWKGNYSTINTNKYKISEVSTK